MKIKSSFRDYYDCMQQYGQDDDILYIRERGLSEKYNTGYPDPEFFYVGFCGEIYPLFQWITYGPLDERHSTMCYSIDDVDKIIDNLDKKTKERYYERNKNIYGKKFNESRRDFFSRFFDGEKLGYNLHKITIRHKYKKYFDEFSAPIFVITNKHTLINPRLNLYDFFKIKSPYEAYRDLSMYLANIARPFKPIPKVSDKDLAAAKGYDQYSFRKVKQ